MSEENSEIKSCCVERLSISFVGNYGEDPIHVVTGSTKDYDDGLYMIDAYEQLTRVLHAAGFNNDVTVIINGSILEPQIFSKSDF